jgi:shikimate kinase
MRHVALIGMMGSGKSTVGRRVAALTGREFIDLDEAIVAREGTSIPEIFATDGEAYFRRAEWEALAAVLARTDPVVVATGGGVITTATCRDLLCRGAEVVWLRASPSSLTERVGDGSGRPLLSGEDPAAVLNRLATDREPLYAVTADVVVHTDGLTVDAVAELVVSGLASEATT